MKVLSYQLFQYFRGLRKPAQLMRPTMSKLEDLQLPKQSVLHYVADYESTQFGPELTEPYFKGIKRVIPLYHVTELTSNEGNPRKLPGQPPTWIRTFHTKNRQFRKTLTLDGTIRDIMVPFVVNYCLIDRRYRYIENAYKLSHRWFNLQATVLKQMNEIANISDFNQFYVIELPEKLPSISLLREASKNMNLSVLKKFRSGNALMVFEFWKWLGENRNDSMLSLIEPKNYSKINFIIKESGAWTFFNLATLNSYRMPTEEEKATLTEVPKKGFPTKRLQLLFIRYLMGITQVRSGGVELLEQLDETIEEADSEAEGNETENQEMLNQVDETKEDKDSVDSNQDATDKVKITKVNEKLDGKLKQDSSKPVEDLEITERDIPEEVIEYKTTTTGEWLLDSNVEETLRKELEALDQIASKEEDEAVQEEEVEVAVALKSEKPTKPEDGIMQAANKLADDGVLTAAMYRRFEQLGNQYKKIQYPGSNITLEEMAKPDPSLLKLPEKPSFKDNPTIQDKSLLKSTLKDFDKQYIEKVLEKDIAACILSLQKAGHCVVGLEKERIEDANGVFDSYKIKVQPVEGAASTLWMKLPVLDKEGNYRAGNSTYRIRRQRFDLPIRKVAPDKVSLTSYYGKLTAIRSNKKVTDYGEYIRNKIMALGLDTENDTVVELLPASSFDSKVKAPRLYSLLSMRFKSFRLAGYTWYLDYHDRKKYFKEEDFNEYEKDGTLLVGKNQVGDLLLMDKQSRLYFVKKTDTVDQFIPAPTIEEMLGLDRTTAPVDIVGLKVLGKIIPIGYILSYNLGLEALINSLGINYRRVPAGSQLNLADDEWRLVFKDESLIFSREDVVASMILAGLKDFHRELKKYSVYEFDRKDVYLNLLESVGLSVRYMREIDLLFKMFVDPITEDVLREMNEPTHFMGLLIRCVEMLQTDDHPDEIDPNFMRIRSMERIAGAVYGELVKTVRAHNSRAGKSKVSLDLNPYAVWRSIAEDPAVVVVNEINPIQNLKEVEAVTYSGAGGRTSRTMVKHTREFHQNDVGTMSESTVDSSDVGINVFLSTNPKFTSLRGTSTSFNPEEDGASSLFSTSFLLAPAADTDDPKRQNFISIQNGHLVSCPNYKPNAIRTGQESVIANRVGKLFANIAEQDGTVTNLTEDTVTVTYKDGTMDSFDIGIKYGAAAGLTIPHKLKTELKLNQKFKAGDTLSYNEDYFTKDRYSGGLVMKGAATCNVVLYETELTDEDSCTLSQRLADSMSTRTTKVREIVLNFDQSVRNLVLEGTNVEPDDPLCIIEDTVTAATDVFDEVSLDTLGLLGSQTPLAKAKGVVDRIEVFYNGDIQDMSESLAKLARETDRRLAKKLRAQGKRVYTNAVNEGYRVEGNPVELDTLVIKVYINSNVGMGVGDYNFL